MVAQAQECKDWKEVLLRHGPEGDMVHKMQRVHFICRNYLSAHVLISIAPVGLIYITHKYAVINGQSNYTLLGCLYIIKSLYNHPLPMATGAIHA